MTYIKASFENNTIPQCAFSYYEQLGYNYVGGYSIPIFNIVLPTEVLYIGDEAFASVLLRSVVLPKEITEISKMCFVGNMLEAGSLVIPDGVTNLQESCFTRNHYFKSCYLDEIILPKTLTNIYDGVFSHLKSKSIVSYAVNPPEINEYNPDLSDMASTLYVPVGSREKYAAAPGWSRFENINERDGL